MEGKDAFAFKYPIEESGIPIKEDFEISNKFALFYSDIFKYNNNIYDFEHKLQYVNIALNLNINSEYNKSFNVSELVNAIFTLYNNGVMGGDFIHNKFLSNFPKPLYTFLLSAINSF